MISELEQMQGVDPAPPVENLELNLCHSRIHYLRAGMGKIGWMLEVDKPKEEIQEHIKNVLSADVSASWSK